MTDLWTQIVAHAGVVGLALKALADYRRNVKRETEQNMRLTAVEEKLADGRARFSKIDERFNELCSKLDDVRNELVSLRSELKGRGHLNGGK